MPGIFALLGTAWRLWRAHAALLSGLFAWLLIPFAGALLFKFVPNETAKNTGLFVLWLVTIVLSIWIVCIGILAVHAILKGNQKLSLEQIRAQVRPLLWPFVIVGVLQVAVIIGGLLLLIIPGILFMVWYAFAQFAVLLDGKRGLEALSHSRSLVRGRFWPVLWRLVAGPVLVGILYAVVIGILTMIWWALTDAPLPDPGSGSGLYPLEGSLLWLDVLDTIVQTLVISPVFLVYGLLLYEDLKKTRHGG
jgi:hypothetical protein